MAENWERLRSFSTSILADAVEVFKVRLRNEGFARGLSAITGNGAIVAGYAVTGRVKSSDMPFIQLPEHAYSDMTGLIRKTPGPKIVVIQDEDERVGLGACLGVRGAAKFQALGCSAFITNGSVRDAAEVEALGFPMFATGLSPSRSYGRLLDWGHPVKICGLTIQPGDLLVADNQGVVSIPLDLIPDLLAAADEVKQERTKLIEYYRSREFRMEAGDTQS